MPLTKTHIDTILFDFDGTIADTLKLGVEISNKLSDRFGYKKISNQEDLDFYRNQTTQEALKAIGISLVKLPFIANSFRQHLAQKLNELQPVKGMVDVVSQLSKQYTLGIITSNSSKNIDTFLKNNNLGKYFQFRSAGVQLFGKSACIKSIIKEHRLDKGKVILIGDETRDIEAARKCKLPVVSVCWGLHTCELLTKHHPDQLVRNPQDLLRLLT